MKRKIIIPLAMGAILSVGALTSVQNSPDKEAIVAKAENEDPVTVFEANTFAHLETGAGNLGTGGIQIYAGRNTGRADSYANWDDAYTGGTITVDNQPVSGVIKIVGGEDVYIDLDEDPDVSQNNFIKLDGTFTAPNGNTFVAHNIICFLKQNVFDVTSNLKPFLHEASNVSTGAVYLKGSNIDANLPVTWDIPLVSVGGKVKLNDQELNSFTLKRVADGGNGFYLSSEELQNKAGIITLDGDFAFADANATFKSNFVARFSNFKVPMNNNYGTISGTGFVDAPVSTNIAGGQVYITANKPSGLISTWDCQLNDLTVKINDVAQSGITVLNVEANRLFLEGEAIKSLKKGDVITIDGVGSASIKGWPNANAFYKVSFDGYKAVFGGAVSGNINVAMVDKNFVYLNATGLDLMPEADWEKPYTGGSVKFNGETVEGVSIKYIPGNQIFVELPTDKAYAVGTWTMNGDFKNGDDVIGLNNVQFSFVKQNFTELRKTGDDPASKSWLYLRTTSENTIPSDGDWNKRMFPLSADALKLTRNGVTTNIAVAGTASRTGGTDLVKTTSNALALEIPSVTDGIQVGDIITIGGTWAMNSESTFYMSDITEQKFMYTEQVGWIKIVETSVTAIDVNWGDAFVKLYYPEAASTYSSYNPQESGAEKNTWSSGVKDTGLYDKIIVNNKQTLTDFVTPTDDPGKYNVNVCDDNSLKLFQLTKGYIGKNAPTTITIKAGALLPTDSESFQILSPVGIFAMTTEDVTFSWNGSQYVAGAYTPAHSSEIGYITYVNGKYIGFEEAFEGMNAGWDASYAPYGDESYLKYNDTNYYSLISTGSASFYFEQMPTPEVGDVIELAGTFVSKLDNTLITIEHSKFQYTADGWVIVYDVARKQFELGPQFDAYKAEEIAGLGETFKTACGTALTAGKAALEEAETIEACETALATYKAAIDAQIAANTLYSAQQSAITDVTDYQSATINSMEEEDKTYCQGLLTEAVEDINDCTDEAGINSVVTEYKAAIDEKINAVALGTAKANAVSEVEGYKATDIAGLSETDKGDCAIILNTAKTAIQNATTVTEVNDAVSSYKTNIDAKLAAAAFEDYKASKAAEMEAYQATAIAGLQESAKTAYASKLAVAKLVVNSAETQEAVDNAVAAFKADIDAIIDLETYKQGKVNALTFNSTDYLEAEIEQINTKKAEIAAAIMAATTKAGADAEFAKFATYLATVKTKAQYAAELATAKTAKSAEIDEYFATVDADEYLPADYATIEGYYESAQLAVQNATNVAGLENILETLQSQIAGVSKKPTEQPTQPSAPAKGGCGGSVVATSALVTTLTLAGASILISKKRKEDK